MAEDILVNADLESGASLVRALDEAGFPVTAALWLFHPDSESWKLVIGTPRASGHQQTFMEIRRIANAARIPSLDLARILLLPPTDPTIATLSKVIRVRGPDAVRLSRNMINGLYVDDAYIYRTAA